LAECINLGGWRVPDRQDELCLRRGVEPHGVHRSREWFDQLRVRYAEPLARRGRTGRILGLRGRAPTVNAEANPCYYRARYYDSQSGRFISEDKINFRAGIDFYIYAYNQPLGLIDPYGYCAITLMFEPPTGDPGAFMHAFIILLDNTTGASPRPWEFRAGPDDMGNNRLSASLQQYGPGRQPPIDDPADARYSISLLNNDCSCTPFLNKLATIDQFLAPGQVPYKRLGPNSNTVASTAINFMGLPTPNLPFPPWRAPGWGGPLPGWPPAGPNGKK